MNFATIRLDTLSSPPTLSRPPKDTLPDVDGILNDKEFSVTPEESKVRVFPLLPSTFDTFTIPFDMSI